VFEAVSGKFNVGRICLCQILSAKVTIITIITITVMALCKLLKIANNNIN
jgi:hypothetical protein